MAKIPIDDNYQYSGGEPFDAKLKPVEKYIDLVKISSSQRYEGMMIWVKSEQKYYVYSQDIDNPLTLKWNTFESNSGIIDGGVIE